MNNRHIALAIAGILLTPISQAEESSTSGHTHEHEESIPAVVQSHEEHDDHDHEKEDHREHESHDEHKPEMGHDHDEHGEEPKSNDTHESDGEHDHDHDVNVPHKEEHSNHSEEDHVEHETHDEHKSDADHDHNEHAKDSHSEHEHEHEGDENHVAPGMQANDGHDHEEASGALLTPAQLALADIRVEALKTKNIDYQLYAPGELLSNGYTSYRVSPRVASVVLQRHVALGDHVKQGQPLVTLFSEQFAQAQAEYRTALPEWQRVRKLGRKTVGEKRYINAKSNLETAKATLQAYGLSAADLKPLATQKMGALGEYTLRAKIDGAVLADDFEQGQRIEAGARLITLADEKQLWVEAHLPSDLSLTLGIGTKADIVAGDVRVKAEVSQEAHTIDPITRTRTVRLLVNNPEHRLHPGQFADVFFRFHTEKPVLAVPETALMRGADGDWTVFVEDHPGEFQPMEVDLGRALGKFREISGIEPGTNIVTKGAFFVASQIAKGGFDPHNH